MMKSILKACALISINITILKAQDPYFTQYKNAGIYSNPAMAGAYDKFRINAQHRSQWANYENGFQTTLISIDNTFSKIKGGIGYYFIRDNSMNTLYTTSHQIAYAPKFSLSKKHTISVGCNVGVSSKKLNTEKLVFGDPNDPILSSKTSKTYFDIGLGFMINSDKFLWSVASNHINRPKIGFMNESYRERLFTNTFFEYYVNLSSQLKLVPSVFFVNHYISSIYGGSISLKYKFLILGGGFRNADVMILGGLQHKNISFTYSFDKYNSVIQNLNAHEISFRWLFKNNKSKA